MDAATACKSHSQLAIAKCLVEIGQYRIARGGNDRRKARSHSMKRTGSVNEPTGSPMSLPSSSAKSLARRVTRRTGQSSRAPRLHRGRPRRSAARTRPLFGRIWTNPSASRRSSAEPPLRERDHPVRNLARRPGRARYAPFPSVPATPERTVTATTIAPAISLWRNPGDDLDIAPFGHPVRPTRTKALACIVGNDHRSAAFQGLIREKRLPVQIRQRGPSSQAACELD